MSTPDLSATQWRKSSRSTDTGGDCVEIALLPQEMSDLWSAYEHPRSVA